jgi:phosphotransferase system  glucose/maltose/N-acetylglucosamine-specific IIC component
MKNMQSPGFFGVVVKRVVFLSPMLLAGCQVDTTLRSNEFTWLWGVLPFAGFGVVGLILVYYRRKAQIAAWDLRDSPAEPSAKGLVIWALVTAGIIAAIFCSYNFILNNMDFTQKLLNTGLWFFGTILGTALALLLGLKMAEPSSIGTGR